MKLNTFVLLTCVFLFAVSCKMKNKSGENLAPNVHQVTAEEVIQTSGYTYIRVSEENKETWIAITRQEVEKGKSYYYQPNIEMTDFVSKELKRTFKTIVFVDKFSVQPITLNKPKMDNMPKGAQPAIAKEGLKFERAEGGITIAELYANKDSYTGKTVRIKGEVIKYNEGILGKNWVHLQDGTNSNGSFDVAFTTNDVTKIGDVVTFEGTVALKKDFGYGYFYEVLIENGKLITQK